MGGEPKNFNTWTPGLEPALVRAGDDIIVPNHDQVSVRGSLWPGFYADRRDGPVTLVYSQTIGK